MCGQLNEVNNDHYSPLGTDGRRLDADSHPQLAYGSVEFVAPQEYMVRRLLSLPTTLCSNLFKGQTATSA